MIYPTEKKPVNSFPIQVLNPVKKTDATRSVASVVMTIENLENEQDQLNIENILKKSNGVHHYEISFLTRNVRIEFQPSVIKTYELVQRLKSVGYPPLTRQSTIHIEGMHCASCVARIENILVRHPQVIRASVLLNKASAIIEYLPGTPVLSELEKQIRSAGYTVAHPVSDHEDVSETIFKKYTQRLKQRWRIAVVFTIPVMVLSMWMPEIPHLNWLLLALTLPVVIYAGHDFYITALRQALKKTAGMDTLVAVGTGSAFLYSLAITFFPNEISGSEQSSHVYYETAAVIITLILTGRLLEARAKRKTTETVRLLVNMQPSTANRITYDNSIGQTVESEEQIPVAQIQPGDTLMARAGDKIAADGIIVRGEGSLDESMLTGESTPVYRKPNDPVLAGTILLNGVILYRAERTGEQTTWGKIIRMVQQAQAQKPPIQKLVDRISAFFVPVILIIALITLILWLVLAPEQGVGVALTYAITVLIVACPCALGLATPTAITVAIGRSATKGLLIKNAETLETLSHAPVVALDKTGTLTTGKPEVHQCIRIDADRVQQDIPAEAYILAAERASTHPLAGAIVRYLTTTGQTLPSLSTEFFQNHAGAGIEAKINGQTVLIGHKAFMQEHQILLDNSSPDSSAMTIVYAAINNRHVMTFYIHDTLRPDIPEVISELHRLGKETVLLSGDTEAVVHAVARSAGIRSYHAGLLPGDKQTIIRQFQQQGKAVIMIGDGINDAPALMQADTGIAVRSGTDVAMESADIVLMKNDLRSIPLLIRLAEQTRRVIRQNLFWAFFYNVISIPVAAGLFVPFFYVQFDPMIAAAMMAFSSVSVVTNSLRIKAG